MLSIFLIGLALSMDAFSLALGLGTIKLSRLQKNYIIIFVGGLHFIMPILGFYLSSKISEIFQLNFNILVIIIFIYTGIYMLKNNKETNKKIKYNIFSLFLLCFSVSVDSFTIGLGLQSCNINCLLAAVTFCLLSLTVTFIGLTIGQFSIKHLKEKSPILGGIIFFILAFVNIIKHFT